MTLLNDIKEQPKQAITPMPSQEQDSGGQVLEFTGLDLREKAGSGAYLECSNVSTRNYPCLSPRIGRSYADESVFQGVDDIFRFDGKTVYRKGTALWFDNGTAGQKNVGTVEDSKKTFAVVNTKLTIWPDGTYIDLNTGEHNLLGAKITVTGGTITNNNVLSGTFTDSTGTVTNTVISKDLYFNGVTKFPYFTYDDDGEIVRANWWSNDGTNFATAMLNKYIIPAATPNGYAIRYSYVSSGRDHELLPENTVGVTAKITSITQKQDRDGDVYFRIKATVTVPQDDDLVLHDKLREGDVVFVSGLYLDDEETKNVAFRIFEIDGGMVKFRVNSLTGYSVHNDTPVTIERRVPQLAYVCSNSNRLWGVSNSIENTVLDDSGMPVKFTGRAVFSSKLGDPCNWYYYQSVSMDSWTAAVASEGDFTGICSWSDDVLCFKEKEVFRITGSVPSAFTLYSFSVPGVEQGSGGSIAVIDEVVYYKSEHGVYRYSGGTPTRVSENVAAALTGAGNAGTDGRNYFLSVPGGIYVYDTWHNAWAKHDTAVGRFAWDGGVALFLNETDGSTLKGTVSRMDGGTADGMLWDVTLHPDYGTTQTGYYTTSLNLGYKYYKFIFLRGELLTHSDDADEPYVRVYAKMGNHDWDFVGQQKGTGKFVLRMPVERYREDSVQIKMSGRGDCVLRDIRYVYSTGSEWIQSDKGVM